VPTRRKACRVSFASNIVGSLLHGSLRAVAPSGRSSNAPRADSWPDALSNCNPTPTTNPGFWPAGAAQAFPSDVGVTPDTPE